MDSILRTLTEARELTSRYLGIVATSVLIAATALATPFLTKLATDEVVAQLGGGGGGLVALVWIALGLLLVELTNTVLSNLGGYLGDLPNEVVHSRRPARQGLVTLVNSLLEHLFGLIGPFLPSDAAQPAWHW